MRIQPAKTGLALPKAGVAQHGEMEVAGKGYKR